VPPAGNKALTLLAIHQGLVHPCFSEKILGNVEDGRQLMRMNFARALRLRSHSPGSGSFLAPRSPQTVGQRRSQVDDARRAAVQTASQFWSTLQAARASISSFAAAVRAAQIALEGTQQEALVGTRTVLDVLIANQQLLTTQSQLVTAQHDAALAEFNLASAVGRLIAPELNLPVRLYDMEQHYRAVKDKWIGFRGGLSE